MTDFELIYMLNEIEDTMWMHIMNYISIIFAMLVTAYFIGGHLTRLMSSALIALFSLGAMLFFGSAITARMDYVSLATMARATLMSDQAHMPPLNMFNAPGPLVVAMDIALYVILIFAYVATLVFFVQARKRPPAGAHARI